MSIPREFKAVFNADLAPERIEFTIRTSPDEEPRDCWIEIRTLDSNEMMEFLGMVAEDDPKNLKKRMGYLASHSIVDWLIWHRPRLKEGGFAPWQQHSAPADWPARRQFIESQFATTPAFYKFLMDEVSRVNGLTDEAKGNSEAQ